MSSRSFQLLALAVALCLGTSIANTAEIRAVPLDPILQKSLIREAPRIAVLEGTIEPGDFEKLRTFILDGPGAELIRLASPGGDLAEAMKIGDFIRMLKLRTEVPGTTERELKPGDPRATAYGVKYPKANLKCTGACFLVFVAGIDRISVFLPPTLGFERPFSPRTLTGWLRREPDQMHAQVEDYLRRMDVPPKYADEMFSLPRGKVRWISKSEFIADFEGLIPELRDQAQTKCGGYFTDDEKAEIKRLDAKPYKDRTAEDISRRNQLGNKAWNRSDCEVEFATELARGALQQMRRGPDPH